MTPAGTDVAVQADASLATISDEELRALQAQQESEYDDDLFQTPILKIGQPLTREVRAEQAEPGEFINTLTGESLGDKVEFIVSYYQRGRFAADRDTGRAYTAFGDTIPPHWAELVGDEFVGTPFAEYPDAEEVYKERVNAKEIEWGKGPLVSTTHNFTGLALVPSLEEDVEPDLQPVRLSLQRTNVPMVRKWRSLIKSKRNSSIWDYVYNLSTFAKPFPRGTAYLLDVKLGRPTNPDEKSVAIELAQAVAAGRVSDNAASDGAQDKVSEPDAKGGLAV
jgi:hypothetical protein